MSNAILTKKCTTCNTEKELNKFYKSSIHKDGLTYDCGECHKKQVSEYNKTLEGLVTGIYSKQRSNSRIRNMETPDYEKKELHVWMLSNGLYALWRQWCWSGYDKNLTPSPDRLDDYKPYTLDNLRLVTWGANRAKAHRDMRNGVNNKLSKTVIQIKDGVIVKEFYSMISAERETGIDRRSICRCCQGKKGYSHAGGYQWRYA